MEQEILATDINECSHGGIYSVDPRLVKVDCSSSINPLGTPPRAIRTIKTSAKRLAPRYPDPQCLELKKNLSSYLRVPSDWITVGNGAMEIIYWFSNAFAGKRVVIPAPTFCEYELSSRRAGAAITSVPLLQDFTPDLESIIEKAKGADALYLCNPNNPTGMLATKEIETIVEGVNGRTKILVDECFIELVDRPAANSIIDMISEFDNLVVLRSLTKSFGLAGLRIGYSVSKPALADRLSASKIPWNVNGLAQVAAVAAIADMRHLARARAVIRKERKFLYDAMARMKNFNPCRSDANYFMVRLKNRNSTQFRDELVKKTGVLVRDCSTFTGMNSQYIRVAVRTRRENMILLKALERFDSIG